MKAKEATACVFLAPLNKGRELLHFTTYWYNLGTVWFYDSIVRNSIISLI
jgi:hypothetical protein